MNCKIIVTAALESNAADSILVVSRDTENTDIVGVATSVNTKLDFYRFSLDVPVEGVYYTSFYSPSLNKVHKWGSIDTSPKTSKAYTFAVGCCSYNQYLDNIPPLFKQIVESGAQFFMHLGDYYYLDSSTTNLDTRINTVFRIHMKGLFKDISKKMPLFLTYDNHDYGEHHTVGKVDKMAPSASSAMAAYRYVVPHYGLEDYRLIGPSYFKYYTNRAIHVVTDSRSERGNGNLPKFDPNKKAWSDKQREWIYNSIREAKRDKQVVFLYMASEWNYDVPYYVDNMSDFGIERQKLCDFIASENMAKQVFILSGDAHQAAYDDGTGGDFSLAKNCPVVSVSVGALSSMHISGTVARREEQYSHGDFNSCNSYIYDRLGNITHRTNIVPIVDASPNATTRNVTLVNLEDVSDSEVKVTINLMCQSVTDDPEDAHYVPEGQGLKLKASFVHDVTLQ